MLQQQIGGMLHRREIAGLLGGQIAALHQVQRAQDAVQGGAHLVVHHGDHACLGAFAFLCAVAGLDQLGLGLDAVGHVADIGDQHLPFAVGVERDRDLDRDGVALLVQRAGLGDPE